MHHLRACLVCAASSGVRGLLVVPRAGATRRWTEAMATSSATETGIISIGEGDYLSVEYGISHAKTGARVPESVAVFDEGLVRVVVGNGYTPALHDALKKATAAGVEFEHAVADMFGEADPRMGPVEVPASKAPAGLQPGDTVRLVNGATARVTAVADDAVTIDANHPLAGEPLSIKLTVLEKLDATQLETATFAGGCFWGLELAYQRHPGVVATWVGYAQGAAENPTYEQVCSGATGHTEAVKVLFDPSLTSYEALCDLLFDRLGENRYALNRVGNDMGTQYRHGIYFYDDAQRQAAQLAFDRAQAHDPERPVVTELLPASKFWDAEEYHQHYLQKGGQSAKKNAPETIRCYG